jgi:hypothetical protein
MVKGLTELPLAKPTDSISLKPLFELSVILVPDLGAAPQDSADAGFQVINRVIIPGTRHCIVVGAACDLCACFN